MGVFIDCMTRKGLLDKALKFMKEYSYKYETGWLSLMSSCRKYNNLQLGEQIYNEINILFEDQTCMKITQDVTHLFLNKVKYNMHFNQVQVLMIFILIVIKNYISGLQNNYEQLHNLGDIL